MKNLRRRSLPDVFLSLDSLFTPEWIAAKYPILVFKHQLKFFTSEADQLDDGLQTLIGEHRILPVRIESGFNGIGYITVECYSETLKSVNYKASEGISKLIEKFLTFLRRCPDISFFKNCLLDNSFTEKDISLLVRLHVLLIRDHESYWLYLPNMSFFMKYLRKGRNFFIRLLSHTTSKSMRLQNLLQQNYKKSVVPFSPTYLLYDLIGSGKIIMDKNENVRIARRKITAK